MCNVTLGDKDKHTQTQTNWGWINTGEGHLKPLLSDTHDLSALQKSLRTRRYVTYRSRGSIKSHFDESFFFAFQIIVKHPTFCYGYYFRVVLKTDFQSRRFWTLRCVAEIRVYWFTFFFRDVRQLGKCQTQYHIFSFTGLQWHFVFVAGRLYFLTFLYKRKGK